MCNKTRGSSRICYFWFTKSYTSVFCNLKIIVISSDSVTPCTKMSRDGSITYYMSHNFVIFIKEIDTFKPYFD